MQGNTTHVTDADGSLKSFVYDYSFWSHDKYMVDPMVYLLQSIKNMPIKKEFTIKLDPTF